MRVAHAHQGDADTLGDELLLGGHLDEAGAIDHADDGE
jgi:hypothetical protein